MAADTQPCIESSRERSSVSPEALKLPPRTEVDEGEASVAHPARPADKPENTRIVKLPRRRNVEREFLPAALEIIDTPPSPVGRAVGLAIIVMATVALAWACLGEIDIITSAPGRVTSQGKTKVIQPMGTGMVAAINVADGDHVRAGDILIEFDATQAAADRDRYVRDLMQVRLDLARLTGLAAQITAHEDGIEPSLVDPPQDASASDLILAKAAMKADAAQQAAKLSDLDQQIAAKQSEAGEADATIEKLRASLPMVEGQEQIRRDLKDKEYGNKLAWYQANQQLIEQNHDISVEMQHRQTAKSSEQALEQQRVATVAEYQVNTFQELSKARAQASELEAELTKAEDHLRQSTLRAPINGTVQQLAVHTIGGVVTPAEALMSIVPDQDKLVVEALVQNKDVGFVHAGQVARVKIDTFNFTRYGLIDGKVLDVTRDAVASSEPSKGELKRDAVDGNDDKTDDIDSGISAAPVYVAHISLDADSITTEEGPTKLEPGMQVIAEIQTGRRRVINYLLSPIAKEVTESLHER